MRSAADQLADVTGMKAEEFAEGARMAYQVLVREFNRANLDADSDFDADSSLTTDALRKEFRKRIAK